MKDLVTVESTSSCNSPRDSSIRDSGSLIIGLPRQVSFKDNVSDNIDSITRSLSNTKTASPSSPGLTSSKIIRRKREYTIPDVPILEEHQRMIEDLTIDATQLSSNANQQAQVYRILNVLITITITLAGTAIGVLALSGTNTIWTAILGFYISTIKTVSVTFNFESKAALLKEISTNAKRISRSVTALRLEKDMPKVMELINSTYNDLDDLDLKMFELGSQKVN